MNNKLKEIQEQQQVSLLDIVYALENVVVTSLALFFKSLLGFGPYSLKDGVDKEALLMIVVCLQTVLIYNSKILIC